MSTTEMDDDKKRNNIRLAWVLAGFVLLIMISSIPFWKGMVRLLSSGG